MCVFKTFSSGFITCKKFTQISANKFLTYGSDMEIRKNVNTKLHLVTFIVNFKKYIYRGVLVM